MPVFAGSVQAPPALWNSCSFLGQYLCTLSTSVFFLPLCTHVLFTCAPFRPTSCCLLSHCLCRVSPVKATFLLSLSQVLALLVCSLPLCFSFPLSHCLVVYWGSKRRNSLLLSVQKKSHSVFVYEEKLKMNAFSVFLTSHYFQLPMLPAVGQMNNINYQGDIHERIK